MGAWHHLNTDQTGYWVDPEEHVRNLLERPKNVYDRLPGEDGRQMLVRKLAEAKQPEGATTPEGRPIHGAGLYDRIKSSGKIHTPVSMFHQQGVTTSPFMTDGGHRTAVAEDLARQGMRLRLPVEYINQTPGEEDDDD